MELKTLTTAFILSLLMISTAVIAGKALQSLQTPPP